ncbi:hypothetical protein [Streptomyces sp. NPDC051909]|uniref:hypothetical protein n=1 Tax=Streptomyces sp. NPDC051909 TaxID=3154944 RepID=UPI00341414B6
MTKQTVGDQLLGAAVSGAEIFLEHDRASFGNRIMWWPVWLDPLGLAAGIAGWAGPRVVWNAATGTLRETLRPRAHCAPATPPRGCRRRARSCLACAGSPTPTMWT